MTEQSETETRSELKRLEEFADSLRKGSIVHSGVVSLISSVRKELAAQSSEMWSLKLQLTVGSAISLRNITVNKSSTLTKIKGMIENQPQAVCVDRIKVKRSGRAWTQFDSRTLVDCEVVNGDELLIDCTPKSQKQFDKSVVGLARIENCDVKLIAASDILIAALHCFLLDLGFICVMELPSTVPGFAPSLRELPTGTLLPSDWKTGDDKHRMLYKHKSKPGKQFILQAHWDKANEVVVTLSLKNSITPSSLTLQLSKFIDSSVDGRLDGSGYYETLYSKFLAVEELTESVATLVRKVVPDLLVTSSSTTSAASATAMEVVQPAPSPHVILASTPSARAPAPAAAAAAIAQPPQVPSPQPLSSGSNRIGSSVYNAGRADLDPFPTVVIPPGGGGVAAPSLMVPGGAGNLVGPNHPIFSGSGGGYGEDGYGFDYEGGGGDPNGYFFPGSAGIGGGGVVGLGLPQPRFDPFGPVVGPNSGVNVGNPGGRFGGRGGGRGRPAPGEPNPDHLKPPGW